MVSPVEQINLKLLERIRGLEADNLTLRQENAERVFAGTQETFARMQNNRVQIQDLEQQLQQRTAEKEQLQNRVTEFGREFETQQDTLRRVEEAAQMRITGLEEQLQNQGVQLDTKVAELVAIRVQQRAQGEELGENDARIAQLGEQLQNRSREKEAALELSRRLQARTRELDRVILDLRAEMAEQAMQQDRNLLEARHLNAPLQRQLRELNQQNNQHNAQIAGLEEQLGRKTREREQLLNQIDDLEHQEEVNQNAVRDLQHRLDATNQRIDHLNEEIVQERVKVHKAIELSALYIRFYQVKGKVRALKDCQTSSIVCGRIFFGLIGAIFGVIGIILGLLAGGEAMGTTAHVLNASRVRNLESKRKRLTERISGIHGLLAIGPIPSELHNSFWRDLIQLPNNQ